MSRSFIEQCVRTSQIVPVTYVKQMFRHLLQYLKSGDFLIRPSVLRGDPIYWKQKSASTSYPPLDDEAMPAF